MVKAWNRKSPEARRSGIIAAARALLLRVGDSGFSMTAVATEARVSRATVYHHFSSREVLLRDMIDDAFSAMRHKAESVARVDAPLGERLQAVLETHPGGMFEFLHRAEAGASELLDLARRLGLDVFGRESRRTVEILARLLQEGEQSGEIQLAESGLSPSGAAEFLFGGALGLVRPVGDVLSPGRWQARVAFLISAFLMRTAPKGD